MREAREGKGEPRSTPPQEHGPASALRGQGWTLDRASMTPPGPPSLGESGAPRSPGFTTPGGTPICSPVSLREQQGQTTSEWRPLGVAPRAVLGGGIRPGQGVSGALAGSGVGVILLVLRQPTRPSRATQGGGGDRPAVGRKPGAQPTESRAGAQGCQGPPGHRGCTLPTAARNNRRHLDRVCDSNCSQSQTPPRPALPPPLRVCAGA